MERQNSTMETYLGVFVNFKQNNWARLLPIAEFAYNNAKNASIGHTPFKLNCGYHPCVFFKEDTNSRSWSKIADELLVELWELITFAGKISTMLKNFKNKLTIRPWSLGATYQIIKFVWTANISKSNKTKSWKQSFLNCSKSYIL